MIDLTNLDLTKWPRLTVMGRPVTERQASEILLRTDGDWAGRACNNRPWTDTQRAVASEWGWPMPPRRGLTGDEHFTAYRDWYNRRAAWERRWGVIELNYLSNWRISSQWFGGAHGWCDWDGAIGCRTWNIGKHPSAAEVRDDWQDIAKAFPYLELRAQLWPDEGDAPPVVEYVVSGGHVEVVKPTDPIEPGNPWDHPTTIGNPEVEAGCTEQRLREAFVHTTSKITNGEG